MPFNRKVDEDCCIFGTFFVCGLGAVRQKFAGVLVVRQEFLTKKPTKFAGKTCADTCGGTTYYQVAASAREPSTLERELRSLQKISDHYPKYILTLDEDPDADYDGIRRINALRWLLRK